MMNSQLQHVLAFVHAIESCPDHWIAIENNGPVRLRMKRCRKQILPPALLHAAEIGNRQRDFKLRGNLKLELALRVDAARS